MSGYFCDRKEAGWLTAPRGIHPIPGLCNTPSEQRPVDPAGFFQESQRSPQAFYFVGILGRLGAGDITIRRPKSWISRRSIY